ncbi:MAG: hypothetical protein HY901_06305, partial [Deltaproteobacteria bacterium]|nr:hypothetical protein [Deltaproteobacteria bacterium]
MHALIVCAFFIGMLLEPGSAFAQEKDKPGCVREWCLEKGLPKDLESSDLTFVWTKDSNEAWTGTRDGKLLRWNGKKWTVIPTGTDAIMTAAWGADAREIWLAGFRATEPPVLFRWDGRKLSSFACCSQPGTEANAPDAQKKGPVFFYSMWGSSASDIWMTGEEGWVIHYDGKTWTAQRAPTKSHLFAIWGTAKDDVWAVGYKGAIVHYDGTAWSAVPSGTGKDLRSIAGFGKDDILIGADGRLLHWDGKAWSGDKSKRLQLSTIEDVSSLLLLSPGNMWAVAGSKLHHYDEELGLGWLPLSVPGSNSVSGIGGP